jgi:hypothetical protein
MSNLNSLSRDGRRIREQISELKSHQEMLRREYIEVDIVINVLRNNLEKTASFSAATTTRGKKKITVLEHEEREWLRTYRRKKTEKAMGLEKPKRLQMDFNRVRLK